MITSRKREEKTKQEQLAGVRAIRLAELIEWRIERAMLACVKILELHDNDRVELELKVYVEKEYKKRINKEIGKVTEKMNG